MDTELCEGGVVVSQYNCHDQVQHYGFNSFKLNNPVLNQQFKSIQYNVALSFIKNLFTI